MKLDALILAVRQTPTLNVVESSVNQEIGFQYDAKPASTTLTGFGFVQRKDLKSVPLTGYGSPSPFFSS